MSTLLDRILIVAVLLAMTQCSIRHAEADERAVFLITYFLLQDGQIVSKSVHFRWPEDEDCDAHKIRVDLMPDPPGLRTETQCVPIGELPDAIVPGERT